MGRKPLQIKNYKPSQIKALFNSNDTFKIGIRLFAVYQVSLGQSSRKLEDLYNTSFKQITNWVHRFESQGLEGLRDKPGRGRKAKLSSEQRDIVAALLTGDSPENHGYNTNTWTGPLVIDWIEKEFSITFKKAQIYNIIKQMGFSYQKTKGFYPETDIQAQAAFKEDLKKTPSKST